MKKPLLHFAFVISLSIITISNSFALPIGFVDHGNYLTDNTSKLDWLDVTISVNESYNYVHSQFGTGGEYEGWRYATANEFNKLIGNYTGIYTNIYRLQSIDDDLIDKLVIILGSTLDSETLENNGKTYDALYGYQEGEYRDYTRGLIDIPEPRGGPATAWIEDVDIPNIPDNFAAIYGFLGNYDAHQYSVGSFLVRSTSPVPVPAAVWLFGSALIGLIGIKRKLLRDVSA